MTATAARGVAPGTVPAPREPEHQLHRKRPQQRKRSSSLEILTHATPMSGWLRCSTRVPSS